MANANLKVNIVAVDKASKNLDKVGKGFSDIGGIAAGVAAAGVAVFAKQAIDAASDLEETQSKVGVIFGESSEQVEAFGDQAAKSIGQSKTVAMNAAATFATFGKSAGLAGDDLSNFATEFTTLASDLASFNNTTPEEAIEAIGAALRGESEPIRKYGVLLDDATLRQEALAQGLIKTTKEALTPQQKVLAAQAQIYKQTKDAQGDFSRTSDGLANSQRILAAEFQDAQAQLGQFLLPYAKVAVSTFGDMLGIFTEMEPATQKTVVQMVALGGAVAVAGPKVLDLVADFGSMVRDMDAGKVRIAATTAVIAGFAAAGLSASNSASEMRASVDDAMDSFKSSNAGDNVENLSTKVAELERKQEDLNNSSGVWDTLSDGVESFGFRFSNDFKHIDDQLDDYLAKIRETEQYHTAIFTEVARNTSLTVDQVRELARVSKVDLSTGVGSAALALERYYEDAVLGKANTEELGDAQRTLGEEFATAEDKVKAFRTELDALDNGFLDLDAARDKAKASIDAFQESLKENGVTLDGNTEKGRANKDALRQIAESHKDAAASVFEMTGEQGRANQELEKGREAFIKAARAAGRTKKQAEELADQYGLIPTVIETEVKAKTGGATRKINEFVEWVNGQVVVIDAKVRTEGQEFGARIDGARAFGGPVTRGSTYIVGERGPEIFTASRSGYIIPNGGGGSGVPGGVVVNVGTTLATKREIAEAVTDALKASGARGLRLA